MLFFMLVLMVSLSIPIALYLATGKEFLVINSINLFTWISICVVFGLPIKLLMLNFKSIKYQYPKIIYPFSAYCKFVTYGNWKSDARYSDFLAIFDRKKQIENSKLSKMPASIIYYYDRNLKKINSLILTDFAFEELIKSYRKYIEKTPHGNRALCIYDLATLRKVKYEETRGNLEAFLKKMRSERKLEEFE